MTPHHPEAQAALTTNSAAGAPAPLNTSPHSPCSSLAALRPSPVLPAAPSHLNLLPFQEMVFDWVSLGGRSIDTALLYTGAQVSDTDGSSLTHSQDGCTGGDRSSPTTDKHHAQ